MKISCNNIFKSTKNKSSTISRDVLRGISFDLESGDSLSISGPSGAGKSTLLNIISGLDDANKGEIYYGNVCFSNLKATDKTKFRLQNISLVFQSFNLLKDFNVMENIMLPLSYKGLSRKDSEKHALSALDNVDLSNLKSSPVATLSGGEAQRVGIARALAMNSKVILADEPTGNLDKETSNIIVNNLVDICNINQISLVVVSHDDSVLSKLNTNRKIIDGRFI
jgi:ABC-type antimicrobial peptide transport system, ATPase component